MQLKTLSAGRWQVVAPVDEDGTCEVLEAIAALAKDKKTAATAAGFRSLWTRIPAEGPRGLGSDFYHYVDQDNGIYEFKRRNHRILCFEAGAGRLVVCSHVVLKKRQKISAADKKKAAKLRDEFLAAERAKRIAIVKDS